MRRIVAFVGNAFLVAFALDASLTVANEISQLAFGGEGLSRAQGLAALLPLALAPALALSLPIAPGLPLAGFLPALAFLVWTLLGSMPLRLWSPERTFVLALGALQAALAVLAFLAVRRRSGAWWIRASDLAATPFRPLRALGFLVAAALLLPTALAAYTLLSVAASIQSATQGFMRFDLRGIVASERDYTRGDHRVRLIGLVHVGEDEAYRELVTSFGSGDLILAEGVGDRDGLLREGLAYENVAQPLGLVVQPSFEDALADLEGEDADRADGPRIVHADVDLRDFSQETLTFLRAVSQVLASRDLATGLERARELSKDFDAKASIGILEDLIERRNAHLIDEIDAALPGNRSIIVPWGALHLPAIERALIARGFERTAEHRRRLVRYATLIRALTSMPARGRSSSEAAPESPR